MLPTLLAAIGARLIGWIVATILALVLAMGSADDLVSMAFGMILSAVADAFAVSFGLGRPRSCWQSSGILAFRREEGLN